jgi:predicted NAD-dependent protein-ADP-ribosyltransferase YbiA (DUF1768 family)
MSSGMPIGEFRETFNPKQHLLRANERGEVFVERRGLLPSLGRFVRIVTGQVSLSEYRLKNLLPYLRDIDEEKRQEIYKGLKERAAVKYVGDSGKQMAFLSSISEILFTCTPSLMTPSEWAYEECREYVDKLTTEGTILSKNADRFLELLDKFTVSAEEQPPQGLFEFCTKNGTQTVDEIKAFAIAIKNRRAELAREQTTSHPTETPRPRLQQALQAQWSVPKANHTLGQWAYLELEQWVNNNKHLRKNERDSIRHAFSYALKNAFGSNNRLLLMKKTLGKSVSANKLPYVEEEARKILEEYDDDFSAGVRTPQTVPWTVPQQGMGPGKWAYLEFKTWVRTNFPNVGAQRTIIKLFDEVLNYKSTIENMYAKLQAVDPTNSQTIISKATQIYTAYYARKTAIAAAHTGPAASTTINVPKIVRQAAKGYVTFYKADVTPDTECFGNYHILEDGRRICGCVTSEGAFFSKKYGFPLNTTDPQRNPFINATEYSTPPLHELNRTYSQQGRTVAGWNQGGNVQAMLEVLKEKFTPGTPEHIALMATGNATLVEVTPKKGRDVFWATDPGGEGINMLGQLLMQIRGELRGAPYQADPNLKRKWY